MQFQKIFQGKREGLSSVQLADASISLKNNSFWFMFLRDENIVNNEVDFGPHLGMDYIQELKEVTDLIIFEVVEG